MEEPDVPINDGGFAVVTKREGANGCQGSARFQNCGYSFHLGKYARHIVTTFAIAIQMCSLQGSGQAGQRTPETKQNAEALISSLRAITRNSDDGVEILMHGSCTASDSEAMTIPPVLWKDVDEEGDRAATISAALRENKQLSVARITPHVIVVRDATVPQNLLETKIDILNLTKREQYSPEAAIAAAINSKAIQLALGRLGMRLAVSQTGLQHVNPSNEPHMVRTVKNVTLGDVLSSVLEKFGGFVVYVDCVDSQGKRRFDVRYYK
jgi:hypothetical protein